MILKVGALLACISFVSVACNKPTKDNSVSNSVSASPAPQTESVAPPASMLRFTDALMDKVVSLNPGSDTVSVKDLESIRIADLQPLAKEAQGDFSKIERLTNYLKPATRLKLIPYFNTKLASISESCRARGYSKAEILAGYQRFKKILALDGKTLNNNQTELEAKDLNASEPLGAKLYSNDDSDSAGAHPINQLLAISFAFFALTPAWFSVIVAFAFLSPIVIPLTILFQLLSFFGA